MDDFSEACLGAARALKIWVDSLDTPEKINQLKSNEKDLLFRLAKLTGQEVPFESPNSAPLDNEVPCFED